MTINPRTKINPSQKKMRELILYVAERSASDPCFGRVKLNKTLFYADFLGYAALGKPITGMAYSKMTHGPVPKAAFAIWKKMEGDGDLVEIQQNCYGFRQKRIMARRSADLSVFSKKEIALIEQVIAQFKDKTAAETSDISHLESGWRFANDGEEIPYETVFVSLDAPDQRDMARTQILSAQFGW